MFKSVLLALACSVWINPAYAEIYLYTSASNDNDQEIRLSNLPLNSNYQTLIKENTVAPAKPLQAINSSTSKLPFDTAVSAAALTSALEPALIHAVIAAESGHNTHAVSPRGARGLMQLMPATAKRFQVNNLDDPAQNVLAGARYLRELRDLYQGDLQLTLAAYNAGPEAVMRYGNRVPPYIETRQYVPKVLRLYRFFSSNPR